jgi:outer membrane protein W
MKSIRYSIALAALFIASSLFAADRTFDLTGWASYVDPNSNGTFNSSSPNQPFDINFNGKLGYGLSANIFWGSNISTELYVAEVQPEATFSNAGNIPSGSLGTLKMIPITGTLQFHFIPKGTIDPYIGAGAAYVLFDKLDNRSDINHLGVNRIDFKDDVGLVLNAGLGFALTPNIAIVADGKYVPITSSANAVFVTGPNTTQKIKINPVIFSGGLQLRF